jgi:hypothetical protein
MQVLFLLGLKSVAIGMRHMRRERRCQVALNRFGGLASCCRGGGFLTESRVRVVVLGDIVVVLPFAQGSIFACRVVVIWMPKRY